MAYLYNYAGQPWKTQKRVQEILMSLYSNHPDGLPGNEDCGQMSAWYVMSALGFYPVTPGDDKYIIGTPLFERATIKTKDKEFIIIAKNVSPKNFYIQSASLNEKEYPYAYLHHGDIIKGGTLTFTMSDEPSNWGSVAKVRPLSFIDRPFLTIPLLLSGERVFRDTTNVALAAMDKAQEIFFSNDGSDPRKGGKVYSGPIPVNSTSTVKAVCHKDGLFSKVVTMRFNKVPTGRTISVMTKPHSNYTGGGVLALIDGITGTLNFHSEPWQGYEGVDFEAVIDLGRSLNLSTVSTRFLQDTNSWIFFPKEIIYSISKDGENYTKIFETMIKTDADNHPTEIRNVECHLNGNTARYVKVFARSFGPCPPWHLAPGGKTWIFVDEIDVR
jgi:hypothetical protein